MTQRPELVIGFVGPAGVNLRLLCDKSAESLRGFKYKPVEIRLSKLLERYTSWTLPQSKSEDVRIDHLQKVGHDFRSEHKNAAALVLAAVVAIREERMSKSGSPDIPADGVAYLLNQLKHPNEVKLLRELYGSSFVLIAAHATKDTRRDNLIKQIADSEGRDKQDADIAKALDIIRIDELEPGPFIVADELGQNTRNTYPLADMFLDLENDSIGVYEIGRFIDLLFGHPFHSPRPDEVAMYHANAASLRSSDESRQVGAVIVDVKRDSQHQTTNIEIVATGMNEVPMRGGGFYWDGTPNSPDARDQWLIARRDDDRALTIKKDVLSELLEVLKREEWLQDSKKSKQTADLLKELIPLGLKGTQFLDLGEFQRQVHAEMAALIDSARRGVAVDRHTMYVTTFPCHNCAKHIIAAGIKHVVYLEPYPKSRAVALYEEEIDTESKVGAPTEESKDGAPTEEAQKDGVLPRVVFSPYTGIAPRQYQRLFNMTGRGKKVLLGLRDWDNQKGTLAPVHLVHNAYVSYMKSERETLAQFETKLFKWDPKVVCP